MSATITTEKSEVHPVRRVLANRNLRRIQLAFAGSAIGDWAYATAITVWAFEQGGAKAVGAFVAVRFAAVAIAGPLGAAVVDRMSRRNFMMISDLVRAGLVTLATLMILFDGPAIVVYITAVLTSIAGAPFRSAQAGLIPSLVNQPDELTASNAVASNIENLASFAGPALGALLVGKVSIEAAMWVNVGSFLWSSLMVSMVRPVAAAATSGEALPAADAVADAVADVGDGDDEPGGGFIAEVTAGFRTLVADRDLRVIAVLAAAQGFIWGLLTVYLVMLAAAELGDGASGVGYLNATMGIGTVLGGLIVLARVGKSRLGRGMVVGVLGWALPLLLIAAAPSAVTVFIAVALIGFSDPWVNLTFDTVPQRLAPEHVISRVYAAVESSLVGAMALGAAGAPALIRWVGFRPTLVVVGIVVGAYAISALPRMARLDHRLVEPEALTLLRSIGLFSPLDAATLETLAQRMEPLAVPAGTEIVRQGETSDRFYVIKSGKVEVTQDGVLRRTESVGEFFGEIGLLRDVPRTATVAASVDSELLVLERDDFLEAMEGNVASRFIADGVIATRLAV